MEWNFCFFELFYVFQHEWKNQNKGIVSMHNSEPFINFILLIEFFFYLSEI